MNHQRERESSPVPVMAGLACLLVGLLVFLSLGVVSHDSHSDPAGQHACAACLIAHGGLIADGAIGAAVFIDSAVLALPRLGEPLSAPVFDLRLAPGRAPPV